jgi:uncharacterized RmlC-like cupin family protein
MTIENPNRPGLEPIGACTVLREVVSQPGVETVEGRLVPLLTGAEIRSHIIVMHPGQYCDAHPHDSESIIYTISGRWVFATRQDGVELRTVIGAGDLFHFPGGEPTGFETPFDEPAVILIAKPGAAPYEESLSVMSQVKDDLEAEARAGTPFTYRELPADHPAREFARQVSGSDPGATPA